VVNAVSAAPEIHCPFPVRENPYGGDCEDFLTAMLDGVGADNQLRGIGIGRLAALAYPDAAPEPLRIAALWFAFFWLFDEAWADRLPLSAIHDVGRIHRRVAAVLSGARPTTADHPSVQLLGALLGAIRSWRPRWDATGFRREILRYLQATLWELDIRRRAVVPSLSDYLRMRPLVAAVPPSRELSFLVCDLRLDPPLSTHPCVELADAAAGNYSCWVNDLCSLGTERGSTMNLVVVARHEFGWSQERAVEWLVRMAHNEVLTFQALRRSLPGTILPPLDLPDTARAAADLDRYLAHYEGWFVASAQWMPSTPRYELPAW
jgi:5-epi-alpha-selinene synthase